MGHSWGETKAEFWANLISEQLKLGVLYVSMGYATSAYSCCCGDRDLQMIRTLHMPLAVSAIIKEAREELLASKHIFHSLCDRRMFRQPGAFREHSIFRSRYIRHRA